MLENMFVNTSVRSTGVLVASGIGVLLGTVTRAVVGY